MSNIQQKLKINKNKLKREKFLSATDSKFSNFLSQAEYSIEESCIKYAAFPKWDNNNKLIATNRDELIGWNNYTFRSWGELISALKRFQQVKNYIGWFFIDHDGPYFKISLNAFLSHIPNISDYGILYGLYNYGWVGAVDNVGIIIEKNPKSQNDKKFNISIWGI